MFLACWAVKGGSGTSVMAASLALSLVGRGDEVLLVDLAGDQPAILALNEPPAAGLTDWLDAEDDSPADALARLEVQVDDRLLLLPRGEGPCGTSPRAGVLVDVLKADRRTVIVDCGTVVPDHTHDAEGSTPELVGSRVVSAAESSLLVIRPCYLALRRALSAPTRPSRILVVNEPGRALDVDDIEDVLGVPVVADVRLDPALARAVDAGILRSKLPRGISRALRGAA